MALTVRRLGRGDEAILRQLASADADFDIAGRGKPQRPLTPEAARRYLANSAALHWVAIDDDTLVGELCCVLLPLSAGDEHELLLYEIGVRSAWRKRGVGRLLLAAMEEWMRVHGVAEVWVLADNPGAVAFYRACGFVANDDQPVYMTHRPDEREMC